MKQIARIVFLAIFAPVPFLIQAQPAGTIRFEDISFRDALQRSEKTGKLIFIDCYTSWCAPCKTMEKTVFVIDSVYDYFNRHFVNLKMDMEKGEGVELKNRYKVASFPTYLFVNEKGEIVHRTASLMPAAEFLAEARRAGSEDAYIPLKNRYDAGDRSHELLFRYWKALKKADPGKADKVKEELLSAITDEELRTPFGWKVIEQMAVSEQDRPGACLIANKAYYGRLAGATELKRVLDRLRQTEMFRLIREDREADFFARLKEMREESDSATQRSAVMLEMDFYLEHQRVDAFVRTAKAAIAGNLSKDDAALSFIARKVQYKSKGNSDMMAVALEMARRAAELKPEEYSNQSTLASVCYDMGLKEEGLKAARHARLLANESTSKIQKLAQELIDKLEKL